MKDERFEKIIQLLTDGKMQMVANPSYWPDAKLRSLDDKHDNVDLSIGQNNIIADFARSVADSVKFPFNSAYIHTLSIIANAMTRNFYYKLYDGGSLKPVNLYTMVTADSGSGKSVVHDYASTPIINAFNGLNTSRAVKRMKLKNRIEELKEEKKTQTNPRARDATEAEIFDLKEKMNGMGPINFGLSDVTPEALETNAGSQGGYFSVASDEADPVQTLIESRYSGEGKSAKMAILLKGYDHGMLNSSRISREGVNTRVRGSFSVLAQDFIIDLLMNAARNGSGIAERFFILRDPSNLGFRDHTKAFKKVDEKVKNEYAHLCNRIVNSHDTTLYFDDVARMRIGEIRNQIEPYLAANKKYSKGVIKGFFGKTDQHIAKIASVIHASKHWCKDAHQDLNVEDDSLEQAIALFRNLSQCYVSAVDHSGAGGNRTEYEACLEYIKTRCEKTKIYYIKNETLRSGLKNNNAFKGQKGLSKYLAENPLKDLQDDGAVLVVGSGIYVNPKII